ncbi:MAG: hypothetical protein U0625_13700 [Phycisphaerales bacterium]
MRRRRKNSDQAVSLFSFQDVLACLTGVLIMVSLLLCIDGLSNTMNMVKGPAGEQGAPSLEAAAKMVKDLQEEVATLRRTIDDRKGGVDVTKQEVDILDDRVKQIAQALRRSEEEDAARAALARQVEEAERDASAAKSTLEDARREERRAAMRQRVRFLRGAEYGKAPIFVEVTAAGLGVGELDAQKTPMLIEQLSGPDAERELQGAFGNRGPDRCYVVFIVHDDGIQRFEALRDAVFRRGYEVGWQLWDGGAGKGFLDGAEPVGGGGAK